MIGEKSKRLYSTLDMLPVFQDRMLEVMIASKKAYDYLRGHVAYPPDDLWSDQECFLEHDAHLNELMVLKEQCLFWRKQCYLSPRQKMELLHLEQSITESEKLSQQIVLLLQGKVGS